MEENKDVSTTIPKDKKIKIEKKILPLDKLMQPVPEEYIETYTEDGIEFRGYKAQYAINLLNQVFGLGGWNAQFCLDKIENINKAWLAYGKVRIYLTDYKSSEKFLADGISGAYAKRIENALKGCKTSAFKNACRYLGIGNELYLAEKEEDIIVEEKSMPEEIVTEETPNEIKTTIDLINKATSVPEIESLLPTISKIEGKAIKDLLVQKYNQKKIELVDKK